MADASSDDDGDGPTRTVREPMETPSGGLPDVDQVEDPTARGVLDGAVVGALVFLLIGLGMFLALWFMAVIGDEARLAFGLGSLAQFDSYEVFYAALYAYSELTLLVPAVAVALGVYAADIDSATIHPGLYAGVAALVGAFCMLLVLLAIALIYEPTNLAIELDVVDELLGMVGAVIASVVAGGVTGSLFHARRT